MAERSYFDWNATAPLRPQARAAMTAALAVAGNPSSVHAEGRSARRLVEDARAEVGALVGARPGDVFFTSSGTEANMLALTPHIQTRTERQPRDRLFLSSVEHASVRTGGRFARENITEIGVDSTGRLDLAALRASLAGAQRPLVSIMLANNETGVIQPVLDAAAIIHAQGGLLHVDAVQAVGRVESDIGALDADLLTLSAHKIGGAKGVGALVRRSEDIHFTEPLIRGGGQEGGLRAGTENVPGIAAFGAAAAGARQQRTAEAAHMLALRIMLEEGIRAISAGVVIFGEDAERLPNTTLFALPGMKAETAVIALDLHGIAVSSGAACSSGKVQPSHVLAAMGVSGQVLRGAVRASVGWTTTKADLAHFLDAWRMLVSALSKGQRVIAA